MLAVVADTLLKRGETLSVAESCTGGLIGAACTALSGSSSWFLGGVISYSNSVKISLLKVNPLTLKNYGAVSKECSLEMVIGVREATQSTYSISVTGIAGPSGGSEDKPVGTVFIAIKGPNFFESYENHFSGDRESVRSKSVNRAFELLLNRL